MASARLAARIAIVALSTALAATLSACGALGSLPALEERARAAWSEVQTQHQRRSEFVTRVSDGLRALAPREREILADLTQAHERVNGLPVDAAIITDEPKFREFHEAQSRLSVALGRVFATVERYPELKSNANFAAIQKQWEGIENRVAVATRDYDAAARAHNRELRAIPGRWIAAMFHPAAKPIETFLAAARSGVAPSGL
jgi:LemA protein